jgi:hypothetical protein
MSNEQAPPAVAPQPVNILQLLAAHSNGYAVEQLSEKVKEIVEHLETLATNEGVRKSKAALTIKLTFERDDGIYKIGVDPTVKLPAVAPPKTVFWATPAHGLVQQDPRQMNMPFQDVNRRSGPIVDVATRS